MSDYLEPLVERTIEVEKPTIQGIVLSFCTVNAITSKSLKSSVKSINEIASDIGLPFEILIVDNIIDDESSIIVRGLSKEIPNVQVVKNRSHNVGKSKKLCFINSSGKFIVLFDNKSTYDVSYADLINSFIKLNEKKMLYSELSVIPKELIHDVGGWRELIGGEDIDLFARISVFYGILAYPTKIHDPLNESLTSKHGYYIPESKSRVKRLFNIYRFKRDQIIGCNYKVKDLMIFNQARKTSQRLALYLFFSLCKLGSKFSRIKPYKFDRNNYLVFRESVFESLVIEDFKRLSDYNREVILSLTRSELNYLSKQSKLWDRIRGSLMRFLRIRE